MLFIIFILLIVFLVFSLIPGPGRSWAGGNLAYIVGVIIIIFLVFWLFTSFADGDNVDDAINVVRGSRWTSNPL